MARWVSSGTRWCGNFFILVFSDSCYFKQIWLSSVNLHFIHFVAKIKTRVRNLVYILFQIYSQYELYLIKQSSCFLQIFPFSRRISILKHNQWQLAVQKKSKSGGKSCITLSSHYPTDGGIYLLITVCLYALRWIYCGMLGYKPSASI